MDRSYRHKLEKSWIDDYVELRLKAPRARRTFGLQPGIRRNQILEVMLSLSGISSISDPGDPDRENEDRVGWNKRAAFVIDGATSLGQPVVEPPRSDAAWLAEYACHFLNSELTPAHRTADVIRNLNATAASHFSVAAGDQRIERYRFPTASFACVRTLDGAIEVTGLADCVLFLVDATGAGFRWSGQKTDRSREVFFARRALEHNDGFDENGAAYARNEVLEDLRSRRSRHNVVGGSVWTLGLEPRAAEYLISERIELDTVATGLLCTDGFADLIDLYGRYSIEGLLAVAVSDGLDSLVEELRQLERSVDPDGRVYPRFKRSDDASAILFRLES